MSRDGSEGRNTGPSCVYTALVKENPLRETSRQVSYVVRREEEAARMTA